MDNKYDIIIVGGGIGGLYTALKLQHKFKKIALIEKNTRLGGRVRSEILGGSSVEMGARRFSRNHKNLWKLLKKCDLMDDVFENDDSDITEYYFNGKFINKPKNTYKLIKRAINRFLKQGNNPLDLMNYTVKEIVDKYLKPSNAKWCYDSFPYKYTYCNFDAFVTSLFIREIYEDTFYSLRGGLSQLIDSIRERLVNVDLYIGTECKEIVKTNDSYGVGIVDNNDIHNTLICDKLVLALPLIALSNIKYTNVNTEFIQYIKENLIPVSLYKVFSIYPVTNGKAWFDNKPCLITDNILNTIVPIDNRKGLIMTCYAEGDQNNELFDKLSKGEKIQDIVRDNLQNIYKTTIPEPISTISKYWNTNESFSRKGTNILNFINKIQYPDDNLWLVNNAYSIKPHWMEGSLLSAKNIISHINGKRCTLSIPTDVDRSLTKYTVSEVIEHDTVDDAWLILDGNVYDVTNWIPDHPGGMAIMKAVGTGKDWIRKFKKVGAHRMRRDRIKQLFAKYIIGKL